MQIKFQFQDVTHEASFEEFNSWMSTPWKASKKIDFMNSDVQEALFDMVSSADGILNAKQISLLEQMPHKKFAELFSVVEEADADA